MAAAFLETALGADELLNEINPDSDLKVLVGIDISLNIKAPVGHHLKVIDIIGIAQPCFGRQEHVDRKGDRLADRTVGKRIALLGLGSFIPYSAPVEV